MSQIEVTRLSSLVAVGAGAGNACVSRMSVYFVMRPGEDEGGDEGGTPTRQGYVYAQKITR